MALTPGTNSWATLAQIQDYLTDRPAAEAFFALSETDDAGVTSQTTVTIQAFYLIRSKYRVPASADVSDDLIAAQAEVALFVTNFIEEYDQRSAAYATGVRKFNLRGWSEEIEEATLPSIVGSLLAAAGLGRRANKAVQLLGEDYVS